MTVKDLIDFLKTQPQDVSVAYELHSEYCLLELKDIEIRVLSPPRDDGWVHGFRKDVYPQTYLVFPGN